MEAPVIVTDLGNVRCPQFFTVHNGLLPIIDAAAATEDWLLSAICGDREARIFWFKDQWFREEKGPIAQQNVYLPNGGIFPSLLPNCFDSVRGRGERSVGPFVVRSGQSAGPGVVPVGGHKES